MSGRVGTSTHPELEESGIACDEHLTARSKASTLECANVDSSSRVTRLGRLGSCAAARAHCGTIFCASLFVRPSAPQSGTGANPRALSRRVRSALVCGSGLSAGDVCAFAASWGVRLSVGAALRSALLRRCDRASTLVARLSGNASRSSGHASSAWVNLSTSRRDPRNAQMASLIPRAPVCRRPHLDWISAVRYKS